MFAPRHRKLGQNSKDARVKANVPAPKEQIIQPHQVVTNSLRWHHLSVTFWTLVVAEAKRKVDARGCQQFIDAMVWRIEGSISEAEFSQLYTVWLHPTHAQTEGGDRQQKKKLKRLSIMEVRNVLALKKYAEDDLDMMVSMLLFEQNRKILHTPLSQTEISFCTQEWISLVEQLFFHLDPTGYGYIFFDQIMFLCVCYLDIHPNSEMTDFVVAACSVLQLIKEMKGAILPPESERAQMTNHVLPLEARNIVTLNMMKNYMRARGYSEAALMALLQVVELRLRTLHEIADQMGSRSDVMRWFSVNQPSGKFTVPRCWEYVVAKSIGNQLGDHLPSNPFAAMPSSTQFNSTQSDFGAGYPSYVVYFAVDAPLYLNPELWLGATTDGVASNLLWCFAKQYKEESASASTNPYFHLVQKIVSSYAIGVEQAFTFLQSIRINDDCEELRIARSLVPPPPDGMDVLMRYDISAEQFSQHPHAASNREHLIAQQQQQRQRPDVGQPGVTAAITTAVDPSTSTAATAAVNGNSSSNNTTVRRTNISVPSVRHTVEQRQAPVFEMMATGTIEARQPVERRHASRYTSDKGMQKLQVNTAVDHTQEAQQQETSAKIFSLRQIEARTKDNLWTDDVRHLVKPSANPMNIHPQSPTTPLSTAAVRGEDDAFSTGVRQHFIPPSLRDVPVLKTPPTGSVRRNSSGRFGGSAELMVEEHHDTSSNETSSNNNLSPARQVEVQEMFGSSSNCDDTHAGEDDENEDWQEGKHEAEDVDVNVDVDEDGNEDGDEDEAVAVGMFPPRPNTAHSEHSAPSTVDELELYDEDAGRNAKALRAILRNMGKSNAKVDVEALANIIKLGNDIVANDPRYKDAVPAGTKAAAQGFSTRRGPVAVDRPATGRQFSPARRNPGGSPSGNSPPLATRASRKAVPGRSPKQTSKSSSLIFGSRTNRSST